MYIEGEIILGEHMNYGIPVEGLVQEESGNYVYSLVSEDSDHFDFEKIEVNKGIEYKGFFEIADLPQSLAGKKIVTGGVYFLSTAIVE
jgi:hypothetical protein